jgi:hypothetical protein
MANAVLHRFDELVVSPTTRPGKIGLVVVRVIDCFHCLSCSVEDAVAGRFLPRVLGFVGLRPVVAHLVALSREIVGP